ncbi:hypothetical protein OOT46_05940 [Aquabacterium sp. A7-Y]|uniref:hypothetical protein n=1 Tax=Aquabacterium sp. A7-Y TaxID=1349605 RepID=UPI00223D9F5E|nr:hypothetical protein [Aquabacterium sp. A7-Y]MCW7537393.1 hypothetical protein [Aquabacterium sp. A7-Y]
MSPCSAFLLRVAVRGSLASLASGLVLAACGQWRKGRPAAPLNAPSHWLWGDPALRQHRVSLRYSLTGFTVHHASSLLWAAVHERCAPSCRGLSAAPAAVLRDAAVVTALAAWVDLAVVPWRLSPGFQRHLSTGQLVAVYGAFAAGLAAGTAALNRKRPARAGILCQKENPTASRPGDSQGR